MHPFLCTETLINSTMREEQLRKLKEEGKEVTDLGTSHIATIRNKLHALGKHRFGKFEENQD